MLYNYDEVKIMKKIDLPKWKDKNKFEKTLTIIGIIFAVIIIILALIEFLEIHEMLNILEPIFGIFLFIQGMQYYKYDKTTAIINFIGVFL